MLFRQLLLAAGLCLATANALALTVVFSDDFEDGDVGNWLHTTNHGGAAGIEASALGGGADGEESGGDLSLRTFLIAPPGGVDLVSRASVEFIAPVAASYQLSLEARSRNCSGCVISYDVLVTGDLLARTGPVLAFEPRIFDLQLAAGVHTLTLGIYTTNASSGNFQAFFDDVLITTAAPIPLPSMLLPFAACLGAIGRVLFGRGA